MSEMHERERIFLEQLRKELAEAKRRAEDLTEQWHSDRPSGEENDRTTLRSA
jgi:hypothetical protein